MPRRIHFPKALFLTTALTALGTLLCLSVPVFAQEGISLDTFRPATSVHSLYELTLPTPKKHLKWSVSGLLSHAQEPVYREIKRFREPTRTSYPVWFRRQLDLAGTVGLLNNMEVGFSLPIIIYQINDEGSDDIQRAGIGDPRVDFKTRFFEGQRTVLGAGVSATLPLGHYASSGRDFLGSKLPTLEPRLLMESHFGPMLIAANGGFIIRDKAAAGDTRQPSAITYNLGVGYDIDDFNEPNGFRLAAEAHGEFGVNFDGTSMPLETLFGFKYRSESDFVFTFGGGPGISRGLGTPVYRAFIGVAYDKVQRNCPAGPEDMDGFQDDDRCIDPDNDQDGIFDQEDKCPDEAEDLDKFQDQDGCPDADNDGDAILCQLPAHL